MKLKINEIFYSIQGEGYDAGLPTIFIRLTGCNLRCKYCDTQYAFYEGNFMNIYEIMDKIGKWKCRRVCITGGEPLIQENVYALLNKLIDSGYKVCIETNGSISIERLVGLPIVIKMDYKLPSSAMNDKMIEENLKLLREEDELKFIIWNREDYEYAKKVMSEHSISSKVVMQPVWQSDIKLADWILEDELDVMFSLQLHKIIWGDERGK